MANTIWKVHVHTIAGVVTVRPKGLEAWTDKRQALTEAMQRAGQVAGGFQGCNCIGPAVHPDACACGVCPCHVLQVMVTEERVIAAYNGPAKSKAKP